MSVDSLFSRFNPLVAAVLRSPLHWPLSSGLMLLTVTGRRSGRRYTIPVGYQRDGDIISVLVSESRNKNWWRNYREPAPVQLRVRGRDLRGEAALLEPGSEAFRQACEGALRRVPGLGRVFRIDYHRRAGLSREQLKQLADEVAAVRIALTP